MLTPEQVEKIATLARLSLTDDERARFAVQLSSIIDYVGALGEVDTEGVEPMQHSIPIQNVFGADEPAPVDAATRAALLALFPEREGDLLKVKAVFS
jgi:aspartyl-tRNA(Asn)/glutamyl-tRNA(Gln) amidotransferase subunit C